MNNKLLLGVGAVIVIVVAVFALKGSGDSAGGKTSLEALLKSNKAQECTYSAEVDGVKTSATVYIGNGKMRTDSVLVSDGQTIKGNMIVDGETSYIWSDATTQGIKMTLDKLKAEETTESGQVQVFNSDFNEQFDYSCKGWSVDNSKFTAPSNVTFVDFSAMMPSATPKTSGNANSSQCSTCDQVPAGSSREACKQSLGCK